MTFLNGGAGSGSLSQATIGTITAVGTPLVLQTSDNNNPKGVLSTVEYGQITLPAANSGGFTPGPVNFLILANQHSSIIRVKNAGVEGTEATLEDVIVGGITRNYQLRSNTASTIFGQSYSAAAGVWDKSSQGLTPQGAQPIKMLVPLSPGVANQRLDLGATTATTNAPGTAQTSVMLTGLLGFMVYIDNSHNVQAVPFQLSTDGVTNQVLGVKTQIMANGSNTLQYPWIVKINATQAVVGWWDATNTKNGWVVVTLTAGTLPSAPTIAIGTPSDDTSIATAAQRIMTLAAGGGTPVLDQGTTNLWVAGIQVTTGTTYSVRAYYLTVNAGAGTITLSSNIVVDSTNITSTASNQGWTPCSTATGKCIVLGGTTTDIFALSFGAGAITVAGHFYNAFQIPVGGLASPAPSLGVSNTFTTPQAIYPIDVANNIYLVMQSAFAGGSSAQGFIGIYAILKLDMTNFVVLASKYLGPLTADAAPSSYTAPLLPGFTAQLGDGEFISMSAAQTTTGVGAFGFLPPFNGMTAYADFKAFNKTASLDISGTHSAAGGAAASESVLSMRCFPIYGANLIAGLSQYPSMCVDQATRRVAICYIDTAVSSGNMGVRVGFYAFPRP